MKRLVGNRQSAALNITSLLFLGIFLLHIIAALFGNSYDWDIDHEMYFGTRLLNGELLYTNEYNDKLPIVQYLFLGPAALSSVHAWASLSIALCISAAIALRRSLVVMVKQGTTLSDSLVQAFASCGASYYLFLVSSLPGSLTHINPAAASFSILSLYFLLCTTTLRKLYSRNSVLMLSAVCGSIAISIRPYMAPSIVMLGMWISPRVMALTSMSSIGAGMHAGSIRRASVVLKSILLFTFSWISLLFLAGVALNGLPYLMGGSLDALVDGIRHNAQYLNPNPQSTKSLLIGQAKNVISLRATLLITSSFAVIFSAFTLIKRLSLLIRGYPVNRSSSNISYVDSILLGIVPLTLLELTILSRHYWSHYLQLFTPYLAISFALGLAYMADKQVLQLRLRVSPRVLVATFAIAMVLLSSTEFISALSSVRNIYRPHYEATVLSDIDTVVANRTAAGLPISFLDASHMYSHWQRNESRHGFPHAANFSHIGRGWWDGLDRTSKKLSGFPYSREDLCEIINSRGPALVFAKKDSTAYECFAFGHSAYRRLVSPMLNTPDLIAYERNSYD